MMAKELGFDDAAVLDVFYSALLHDIALDETYDMKGHCTAGAKMLEKIPLPSRVVANVLYHHEFYDGSGEFGIKGGGIPMGAQIICLASSFDDMFGKRNEKLTRDVVLEINAWLNSRRGSLSKGVANAFEKLIGREYFLLDYFSRENKLILCEKLAFRDNIYYGFSDVKKFALCFADIIDRLSPYTYSHSTGIAELALRSAAFLGYGNEAQEEMYIAGLLHDIGKLSTPIEILHKNGKLSKEERFEIKKHAYYTRRILERVEGFERIVEYASNHHEKLSGTGYPYCLYGENIGELERVMAICDVYQALIENRPHRDKMLLEEVWGIIEWMACADHLDKELVGKLKDQFD